MDGETWLDSAAGIDLPAERRGIGYVFQDARLFPHYTVRGNLQYGQKRARGVRGEQPLAFDEVVGLLGLGELLDRRPANLSGGERQRVALSRALLARPRVLLLDEPLASIDAARREEVLPYLEQLRDVSRVPMIFVSHQFDEVLRLATEVAVLEGGRLAVQGAPDVVSLAPALRAIVGHDAIGAVLGGPVIAVEPERGLTRIAVGNGELTIALAGARVGEHRRVQLFARDIILALHEPSGLSVRNCLAGTVTQVLPDEDSDLVYVDVGGGALLLARITQAATRELGLSVGVRTWALVKAVSTRGHAY
jgi:molybdate transport system ATP-binding protein